MLRVHRPAPRVLIISHKPAGALLRLAIWLGVVIAFYLVVLGGGMLPGASPAAAQAAGWRQWPLLLFPLFLLPYLFGLVRALLRADDLTVDGRSGQLCNRRGTLAEFSRIRELSLKTVHGTCEEYRLSAALEDGRSIKLIEAEATPAIESLAAELADLVGADLVRLA